MSNSKTNKVKILDEIRDALTTQKRSKLSAVELIATRRAETAQNIDKQDIPCPDLSGNIVELFKSNLEKASSNVHFAQDKKIVTRLIKNYLESNSLNKEIICGINAELNEISQLLNNDNVTIVNGSTNGEHLVGLSTADAGIAETGTLVLTSSSSNPTRINFLVDHHIVIIKQKDIIGTMEEAWRAIYPNEKTIPRATNFISGPSRTADIEQTIQLGAHGPRALLVIILNEI